MSTDLKTIIEGLLFVADAPLSVVQLAEILETEDRKSIKDALIALAMELEELDRAFTLVEVAGGWRFRTKSELAFWLRKFKKQTITKLSPAALETLSIVAYKQPVLKATIDHMRGLDVGGVLRTLMEKDLVRVMGREDLPGKPLIYGTTRRFLEVFDLKDIKDLPTLDEIDGLMLDLANMEPMENSAQQSLDLKQPGADDDAGHSEPPEDETGEPDALYPDAAVSSDPHAAQDYETRESLKTDEEPSGGLDDAFSPALDTQPLEHDNPWPPGKTRPEYEHGGEDDDTPPAA